MKHLRKSCEIIQQAFILNRGQKDIKLCMTSFIDDPLAKSNSFVDNS